MSEQRHQMDFSALPRIDETAADKLWQQPGGREIAHYPWGGSEVYLGVYGVRQARRDARADDPTLPRLFDEIDESFLGDDVELQGFETVAAVAGTEGVRHTERDVFSFRPDLRMGAWRSNYIPKFVVPTFLGEGLETHTIALVAAHDHRDGVLLAHVSSATAMTQAALRLTQWHQLEGSEDVREQLRYQRRQVAAAWQEVQPIPRRQVSK